MTTRPRIDVHDVGMATHTPCHLQHNPVMNLLRKARHQRSEAKTWLPAPEEMKASNDEWVFRISIMCAS